MKTAITTAFRGKYLSVLPVGYSHVEFAASGNHYSWRKVTTTVHNIIVGKLWIDNHGEMIIENHKTGDKCHLKFIPYSYFSRDVPRKVGCFIFIVISRVVSIGNRRRAGQKWCGQMGTAKHMGQSYRW